MVKRFGKMSDLPDELFEFSKNANQILMKFLNECPLPPKEKINFLLAALSISVFRYIKPEGWERSWEDIRDAGLSSCKEFEKEFEKEF